MPTMRENCAACVLALVTIIPAFASAEPVEPPPSSYEHETDPVPLGPNEIFQIPVASAKIWYYNPVSKQNVEPGRLSEMGKVQVKYLSAVFIYVTDLTCTGSSLRRHFELVHDPDTANTYIACRN